MPPNDTTTVTFRAQIDATAAPPISNQAIVTASGLKGNPATDYPSGNGAGAPGTPTTFDFDACVTNADCVLPAKPICATVPNPNVCVQCLVDADCGSLTSGKVCLVATSTCGDGCRGTGGNGCPAGQMCTSTTAAIGACLSSADDGGLLDGAGGSNDGDSLASASVRRRVESRRTAACPTFNGAAGSGGATTGRRRRRSGAVARHGAGGSDGRRRC